MNIEIGNIYWFRVYYHNTGESEVRPVVVLDITNDNLIIATFATITSSSIKDFNDKYDKWQVPLFHWKFAGLNRASYVKANCVATVNIEEFKTKDYIGKIHHDDFQNVKIRVEEFIESEEDFW